MVYIGLPSNPQFLGRQEPQNVAEVIARSEGPSGKNSEYLFMLEEALDALGQESGDGHVEDLARRVRNLPEGVEKVDGVSNSCVPKEGAAEKDMQRASRGKADLEAEKLS